MRASVLRDILMANNPDGAAWLLDALATAGRAGGPPFDLSLMAAVDLSTHELLPYDSHRAIFMAARAQGLDSCMELLFTADFGEMEESVGSPRPLVPGTRPLTLGERKSLARTWKRDVLERLLVDPHADVVALLLANPRLTEDDVLRIATARRASAQVLNLVLKHKRWNCRQRVRLALLQNPNLPSAAAVRLVGLLNRSQQRELAAQARLPLTVLVALRRRLQPLS
jgi:hypothetical protein